MNIIKRSVLIMTMGALILGVDLLVAETPGLQTPQPPPPRNEAVVGTPDIDKSQINPKLQYALHRIFELYKTQGMDAVREYAVANEIDLDGENVRIVVEAAGAVAKTSLSVAALNAQIRLSAGTVEATYRNLIQSRLPITMIEAMADHPLVKYVRLPLKPRTQTITSEGVNAVGADLWQSLTSFHGKGAGANVVVLDLGFNGYSSLLGTELPSSVVTKSFRSDNDLLANEVHGTACAEIIHDVAPNAKLTLVNFGTAIEYFDAMDWIMTQTPKLEILSNSMAWFNAGDGKGTGPICEAVNRFVTNDYDDSQNPRAWVVAAGNYAQNHWEGTFNDPDNDGWMEFDNSGSEFLYVYVPAYWSPTFFVNWDDWGEWNPINYEYTPGSSQDYDVELWWAPGSTWNYITSSASRQNGTAGQWPTEAVGGYYKDVPAYWGIKIKKDSATRDCKLEVFVDGVPANYQLRPCVNSGSLTIPGDSPNAVTVGAVDWSDMGRIPYHDYSSEGPTHDGRIKPDFSSPSRVSTSTYGSLGFSGTSAATPHFAGILALMHEKTPYTLSQIVNILAGRAIDLGSAGKDSIYGNGFSSMKKK